MKSKPLFVLLAVSVSLLVGAGTQAAAGDPTRLQEVPARIQSFVADGTIAGAVTLVAKDGKVMSLEAVGYADLKTRTPLRKDSLFWIASMTKPITASAVMMLADEGKLSVEDPVEKHLPEFKGQWLVESASSNRMTLKRAARPITIRDLMTHTAGLNEGPGVDRELTLAELALAYSQKPLQFEPGSRWSYSNPGINTLGRIVEVRSGQSFDAFLQQRFFGPLGMKDTTFYPSASQIKRLAKSYRLNPQTKALEEVPVYFIKQLESRKRAPMPAGGLFSTAGDINRFYRMMLNRGTADGRRYLSHSAVEELTRTQTGDIKTGFTDGMSFGFGFAVVKNPQGVTAMLSPGTFGHGGAYGTQSWADPKSGITYILMVQRANFPNGDNSDVRKAFQEVAASALAR